MWISHIRLFIQTVPKEQGQFKIYLIRGEKRQVSSPKGKRKLFIRRLKKIAQLNGKGWVQV